MNDQTSGTNSGGFGPGAGNSGPRVPSVYGPPQRPLVTTSGLAIACFILAIVGMIFPPLAVIAFILGFVSLIRIEASGGRLTGRAFAITGIVLPVFTILAYVALLMPALIRAREQGKRAVCLSNLRQLTLGWVMYTDENDGKIVNGAAGRYRSWGEEPWVGKCWHDRYSSGQTLDEESQLEAIREGALWPYIKDPGLYQCPSGMQGEKLTYAAMDSVNGVSRAGTATMGGHTSASGRSERVGTTVLWLKKRTEVRRPADRTVFIDKGWAAPDSHATHYQQATWWDEAPVRHRDGTNVSFADGHAEYHRWNGVDTIKYGRQQQKGQSSKHRAPETTAGQGDLEWLQTGCWGRLGYERRD